MDPTMFLRTFLLALCVWREARGESSAGKYMVASVIVNRSKDAKRRWPRTIEDVILQPLQFSSFNHDDPEVALYPATMDLSWGQCVKVATDVLAGALTTSANHYHVIGLHPAWADASKVVATEDHHVFYCL